jgi:hypothetical protein
MAPERKSIQFFWGVSLARKNRSFHQYGLVRKPNKRQRLGLERNKTMTEHPRFNDADGSAALGICESLILALTDRKLITEKDARDLLTDVVTSHSEAAEVSQTPDKHRAVAGIVQRILDGKDGVRSP